MTGPKILFASGQRLFPAGWGGAETTAHELLIALVESGWQVEAIGAAKAGEQNVVAQRLADCQELTAPPQQADQSFHYDVGYPVQIVEERNYPDAVRAALARLQPDWLWTQALGWPAAMAEAKAQSIPTVLYVHAEEVLRIPIPDSEPEIVLFNSEYMKAALADRFPFDGPVFPPPIDFRRYRTSCAGPQGAVTLVNPLPVKGSEVFLALAEARPDRTFLAVEGWVLPPFVVRQIERLPNATVLSWQQDMRSVFAQTGVLLVPSRFEPFGRIGLEAGACGIPTLSSGLGGLPEALGQAAIHLPLIEGIDPWLAALRRLEDPHEYQKWSDLARQRGERFTATECVARFSSLLSNTCNQAL